MALPKPWPLPQLPVVPRLAEYPPELAERPCDAAIRRQLRRLFRAGGGGLLVAGVQGTGRTSALSVAVAMEMPSDWTYQSWTTLPWAAEDPTEALRTYRPFRKTIVLIDDLHWLEDFDARIRLFDALLREPGVVVAVTCDRDLPDRLAHLHLRSVLVPEQPGYRSSEVVPRSGSRPGWAERQVCQVAVGTAVLIAAGVRPRARREWCAELVAAEQGQGQLRSAGGRLEYAVGLVRAAVQIRLGRCSAPVVGWLDRIARSETRSRQATFCVVLPLAAYVFQASGLIGLIGNAEGLATIGGCVYGPARWRRKVLRQRDAIAGNDADSSQ
jgi:hypothetical protein